jgi:2,5-diamino-6-(ribosylamino)-4(3H)-pyrimidinone 5'-phosphate reductase
MSLDGSIANPDGTPARFSGPEDLARVHALRAAVDAVLVGAGTIRADDPSLLVQDRYLRTGRSSERQPARVVLVGSRPLPVAARVLADGARTFVLVPSGSNGEAPASAASSPHQAGVVVLPCKTTEDGLVDLQDGLAQLGMHGVRSLLVEGGSRVLGSFLAQSLVDEFTLYVAPRPLPGGWALSRGWPRSLEMGIRLSLRECSRLGEGILLRFHR